MLPHGLRESAGEWMEAEADYVPTRGASHGTKDHIGFEYFSIGSIDTRAPPRLPDVVEKEDAASWCLDRDHHFGISVTQQARAAGSTSRRTERDATRRLGKQHGVARIDRRPAAAQELVEVGEPPIRQKHHPRQRARILVHVSILGTCDETEIAGLERGVDLFHRHASGDET